MSRRPIMGTLAFRLAALREAGRDADAKALLDAHNSIRRACGHPLYNEADDMTDTPHDGLFVYPSRPAMGAAK